jgi:hypothetical protein
MRPSDTQQRAREHIAAVDVDVAIAALTLRFQMKDAVDALGHSSARKACNAMPRMLQ